MPLPRYQPVRKRTKVESSSLSLNDLDDYCLSKVLAHALKLSCYRGDELTITDNGRVEKNLSLVSKRWYFLTQAQVANYGVYRINLDRITTGRMNTKFIPRSTTVMSTQKRRFGVLYQKNTDSTSKYGNTPRLKQAINSSQEYSYNIGLYRIIQPKLLKYKHILIDGSLTCEEFNKLIVALDSSRIERLHLNIKVERDGTLAKDFASIPRQLYHLEELTLTWRNELESIFTNFLTWTVYERSVRLKSLQIYINDDELINSTYSEADEEKAISVEKIANRFLERIPVTSHHYLSKILFSRCSTEEVSQGDCRYTELIKKVLIREKNIVQVETNDNCLIEHLIKCSDRLSTRKELKVLKFSSSIKSSDLLSQLLTTKNLGIDYLSIVIDNLKQVEELRHLMQNFKEIRHQHSVCQICLHQKDQRLSDIEDKVKNLIQLSRQSDLLVYVNAVQRVSIDCCHLMWSVNRALLASPDLNGNCIFKIILQPSQLIKQYSPNNYSEITIPLGKSSNYKLNQNREDMVRHREILKCLKINCYHQFVKSVRDNLA